jgi:PKD repeat protein
MAVSSSLGNLPIHLFSSEKSMKSYTYHLLTGIGMGILLSTSLSAQMVTVNVGINQPPSLVADAGTSISGCSGQTITLGGAPTAAGGTAPFSYNWTPSAGLSSASVANPTLTVTAPATYSLAVTDARNCSSSASVSVAVGSAASAGFSFAASGLNVSFSNTSTGATTYFWDFGNGLTSTFANPSHTYSAFGTYTVCLIASSGGCGDTLCQVVDVLVGATPSQVASASLYPNPFSGSSNLQFTLKSASDVTIEAFDLSGKRLARLLDGELPAGDHTLPIRTGEGGLPNGVYLIKLTVNGETLTLRAVAER